MAFIVALPLAGSVLQTSVSSSTASPRSVQTANASIATSPTSARALTFSHSAFAGRRFEASRPAASSNARFEVRADIEEIFVELPKPLGIVFEEGPDGRVYVAEVQEGGNAEKDGRVNVGDRIKATSATFGDEMWDSQSSDFGRVLAAIKTRQYNVRLLLERFPSRRY
eukprot:CAMPEP_0196656982 /NCGR_PEP_ID=MMETSP1086-20130531/20941_1 /TAXON_ID=77921 /ORGANISM="Cyanoptyche  gloeocystis , Strain SAG4.97" /LENGTH=167 /DNA_ID=CAMNT_0041989941 /DNA_START=78 /DNA_END=581 /DNA_ORIENTATION=+